jgi:hypothetical protein
LRTLRDGLSNVRYAYMPIDRSWIGPVVFLAWMSSRPDGHSDPDLESGFTKNDDWTWRLLFLVKHLVQIINEAGFEPERVQRVAVCAPALASAIIEWRRFRLFPYAAPDWTRYNDLREFARSGAAARRGSETPRQRPLD